MKKFLGIDAGSITAGAVLIDENGKIIESGYSFHHGKPVKALQKITGSFNMEEVAGACKTSSTPKLAKEIAKSDNTVSFIKGAAAFHEDIQALLIAGGEKCGIVYFDEEGRYLNFKANSSCAAGTGSFLDQQARRLNLRNIEEFCNTASLNKNKEEIPLIASRCAVFAKTDLIHAQHEGYSLAQICDGLAFGLAKNISDTLFNNVKLGVPVVFAGGVSKNQAVIYHLESILETEIITGEFSHLYGAIGSALEALNNHNNTDNQSEQEIKKVCKNIAPQATALSYSYSPLKLHLSKDPTFDSEDKYEYTPLFAACKAVETDIYEPLEKGKSYNVAMGIDIGSTSTKAILLNSNDKKVLAGFYTRTSGSPIEAVKGLLEAVENFASDSGASFSFTGAATTGSGRNFISKIIGADLAINEISAHARAAYELDPEVDTIIEIGGQDSKFTTLKNGQVTFAAMNNVCAAGTGSFIEEQAERLSCSLDDYSNYAEGIPAPLASDRCTVFMERDINYLMSLGHSVEEVLATTLHSVRDNYISKVSTEKYIGSKIFFQGATAKNRALVAAFEQRLERPIMVSKFCHLTGAYGAALSLIEAESFSTKFRGTGIYRTKIPVTSEICDICNNNCKLTVVTINDETEAFGFLCGRDYETKKFVNRGEENYNFIAKRNKNFTIKESVSKKEVSIGLISTLYMCEELPLWKKFFDLLSFKTISGDSYKSAVKEGKSIAGAEFCAPISAMYGQLKYLANETDFIFMPFYLEEKEDSHFSQKQYCYYSQFAASLASGTPGVNKQKLLTPMLKSMRSSFYSKYQLFKTMKKVSPSLSYYQIINAYDEAIKYFEEQQSQMKEKYIKETEQLTDIHVILAGRPYTILQDSMNNNIPALFARQGIKVFYSDDLPNLNPSELEPIAPLLEAFHWYYAAKILKTSYYAATNEGAYPVLITSFKCSPDSFAVDYFKMIMEHYSKPYLILQLDEHDSSIGYETRIEAAIRSFRNHFQSKELNLPFGIPKKIDAGITSDPSRLKNKTLLMPNWDRLTCRLHVANLRSQGLDAHILEETPEYIRKSMSYNTGQCIPVNIIAQEAIEYVNNYGLDPAKSAMWLAHATLACNLKMFPYYLKNIFETYGKGMQEFEVYVGELSFLDFSISAALNSYFANYFGGMLRKAACAIRPYEVNKGETDQVTEQAVELIAKAMEAGVDLEESVSKAVDLFASIKKEGEKRPKVAIFGDLYTRYNDVINQELVKLIEENGAEAVITPQSKIYKIVSEPYIKKCIFRGVYTEAAAASVVVRVLPVLERKYNRIFSKIVPMENETLPLPAADILNKFGVRLEHSGESMENLLKTYTLAANDPDISLFVQASPAFCCPSLITEAMSEKIEQVTGIPVVSIEYDGTGTYKNEPVVPYLKLPAGKRKHTQKNIL